MNAMIHAPKAMGDSEYFGASKRIMIRVPSSGGKAGRGRNKSSGVQVLRSDESGGWLLKKTFRYTVGDNVSFTTAIGRAVLLAQAAAELLEATGRTHPCD